MKNCKCITRRISLLLLLVMIFSALPIYAETEVLDVSNWAKIEILDAERYGLYEKSWYKDGFRKAISKEKIDLLVKNTDEKLKSVGNEKNPNFKEVKIGDKTTRAGYLRSLYNILASYENENISKDPILYLNQLNIVKGNGKNLYLNRKITSEEAVVFAKRAVDNFYAKNNAGAKGLMWEAEKNGNKVYMLGSIHMADSTIYPFSSDIINRFDSSDELFVEVDISNKDSETLMAEKMEAKMAKMLKEMYYQDGTTLKSVVGDETYSKLEKIMKEYDMEEEGYKHLKPWGAISQLNTLKTLKGMFGDIKGALDTSTEVPTEISDEELEKLIEEMEKQGKPIDYGIDMYFLLRAKEQNKKVVELESLEMQFELLANILFSNPYEKLSLEEQKQVLNREIESILNPEPKKEETEDLGKELEETMKEFEKQLKAMLDSWKKGDAEALRKVLSEAADPNNMNSSLLGDRDKGMAEKIGKLLEGEDKKTYFVVVGAAHYVTDGMVIDNLKDMGYKVKSLNK